MPKEVFKFTKKIVKNSKVGLLATEGQKTGVYDKIFDKDYHLINHQNLQKNCQ